MSIISPAAPASEEGVAAALPQEQTGIASRGLRLIHLWPIVVFSVVWFATSIDFIEPYDFWWNLKSGEIMMQTGRFLSTDVLVWTPVREPYANPQWGSQLLFYWIFSASPYLLLTARTLIGTATIGLILWVCYRRSGSLRIATLVGLMAFFTSWTNYGIRPQLFAFLPFMAFLVILERKDRHPRWLPLLVPVMLFWVNVHGSFFLGVALLGIYGLGSLIERAGTPEGRAWLRSRAAGWQALWLVAAALITLVNPYFATIYRYFIIATNDPIARPLNVEWQPPTLSEATGQLFYAQVLIFLASIYFSKRRLRPTEILLILAFGYLALTSLRNVMWWGWVTAPTIAENLAVWVQARRESRELRRLEAANTGAHTEEPAAVRRTEIPAFNWAIAVILVGGALLFTPLWRPVNPFVPESAKAALAQDTPTRLADFLKTGQVPAPLFNYMEWGGYLGWVLYPQYQMFIDGRFEARTVDVWRDYLSVSRGRADWQQTLDRYKVRTLVLEKEFSPDLIRFVRESGRWTLAYEDKAAIVFTR